MKYFSLVKQLINFTKLFWLPTSALPGTGLKDILWYPMSAGNITLCRGQNVARDVEVCRSRLTESLKCNLILVLFGAEPCMVLEFYISESRS